MKKKISIVIIFSLIVLSGCGESGITVTGDNATITTNAENNNAQTIVDTDVNPDIDVTNDKSTSNTINNTVSESSIKDSNEYQQLLNEYNKLQKENNELRNKISELESRDVDIPIIEYKDLSLSIDGEDIPVNKSDSMIIIDGREYLSKEIADKLIPENQNITITDDSIFIGKIVADKSNLFEQWIIDKSSCEIKDTIKDSFGENHVNAIVFTGYKGEILFNLNQQYDFLQCTIALSEYRSLEGSVNIIIKADDTIIYNEEVNKTSNTISLELPLNKCKILSIECSDSRHNTTYTCQCIISNAVVYN